MVQVTANGADWTEVPASLDASLAIRVVGWHSINVLIRQSATQPLASDRQGQVYQFGPTADILQATAGSKTYVRNTTYHTIGLEIDYLGGGGAAADPTTALRAIQPVALAGETVSPGEITVNGNRIYRNNTAAAITVPAVTEPSNMTAAGFTEETTPQQINEVVLSTTNLTGAAPAGAKVGRNVTTGQEFSVEGGNWSAEAMSTPTAANTISGTGAPASTIGVAGDYYRQLDTAVGAFRVWGPRTATAWPASATMEVTPDPGNAQTYVFTRTDSALTLPTTAETAAALKSGDIANGRLADGRNVWWRHDGTTWVQTRIDTATANTDTGSFMGAAATFATLPVTSTAGKAVIAGDWALLTADTVGTGTAAAPQYPRGGYVRGATAYTFSWPLDAVASVTGDFIGAAATFATLPTTNATKTAANGDWAVLSAADVGTGTALAPQYPAGGYLYNGTAYAFSFPLGAAAGQLTNAQVIDRASTVFGAVSGQRVAEAIEAEVRGIFMGSAATYATLPTTNAGRTAVLTGDWAFLTANVTGTGTSSAPQYPMGIYRYNGTAYVLTWAAHQEGLYIVADGATLTEGRIHGSSPATGVVVTVTPPAVVRTATEMGWFSVVNNGAGTITVTGLGDVASNTSATWTANAAGTAWVLSSAAPTTTTVNHLALTATARVGMVNVYPSGSNLASHVPPAVVAGRDYAIATANGTTGYDNVQAYVANAAGTAWLSKVSQHSYSRTFAASDWTVAPTTPATTTTLGNLSSFVASTLNAQSLERWQSFTSTVTGNISNVQIRMGNSGGSAGSTARVRFYSGAGNGGTVLADVTGVDVVGVPGFTRTVTFPAPIGLVNGSVYTVSVVSETPSGTLQINCTTDDNFPGFIASAGSNEMVMAFDIASGGSGGAAPGPSTLTIPQTTHLRGTAPLIQVSSGTGPFEITTVDASIAANGNITLSVGNGDEFAGRLIVV